MSAQPSSHVRINGSLLWVASIAGAYLSLWRVVTDWSGKWPAPYWFAVGLGILLAYGLLVREWKPLFWVVPFAGFAVYASWFFSFGYYQKWARPWFGHWWHRLDSWEQDFPTLVLTAVFVVALLFSSAADRGWRFQVTISLFVITLFFLSFFAGIVCSIHLPQDGTFGSFDHDILGFRFGGYYLFMVALSVSVLKIASTKMHVTAPSKPLQATAASP